MECEIAISSICTILNELTDRIKKLMEYSDKFHNNIEMEENCHDTFKNFIKMLENMSYLVVMRIRTSPMLERERASNLATALVNEKKARVEAEILLNSFKCETMKHQKCVNDIKAQIAEEKLHLEQIKQNYEHDITEKIDKLKQIVDKIRVETAEKEEKLKIEIELKNIEFDKICETNLKTERKLYEMRKNAEKKYLEILTMYDDNVGGLYRTMESLKEQSNLLDTNLKICQEKLIIQETEYEMLKTERELEIHTIFTENLNNFKRNRAAKIIQTGWRRYLERLILRKKKKSKKKKK